MPLSMGRTRALPLAAGCALVLTAVTGCGGTGAATDDRRTVTVYSADGLQGENGDGWYDQQFREFEQRTGITVQYVEGGSGEMVQRTARERNNPQADVLVSLPPFIQQADSQGLLRSYRPQGAEQVPAAAKSANGTWTGLLNNYFAFVHNSRHRAPATWRDLLSAKYRDKLQYSTPGVAGDGTAMLVHAMHDLGGEQRAMEYFGRLQQNNVGPSSSTSKLGPKVDKGELQVANGDVQMNHAQARTLPNVRLFFPAAHRGARPATFALPYSGGLVRGAPHSENGKKLLDFLLSRKAQQQTSATGHGFPVRGDVHPRDRNARELDRLMRGVRIFQPDWQRIAKNLTHTIHAWQDATGS